MGDLSYFSSQPRGPNLQESWVVVTQWLWILEGHPPCGLASLQEGSQHRHKHQLMQPSTAVHSACFPGKVTSY